jgi:hypothetical protein
MSLFIASIHQPSDKLDFSQGQLLSNNQGLDTVFGIEHYKFSDATTNKGFHNTVTQPLIVGAAHPTTTTNPIIYAMQDSANLGTIQYSRGPNNAVPTPLTALQSPSTAITIGPGGTSAVFDFAGLARAIVNIYTYFTTPSTGGIVQSYAWTGTTLIRIAGVNGVITPNASGSILQLSNPSGVSIGGIYWTLEFERTT